VKSALVTGGSSGIGLAIARALSEDGFALTLAARKVERLDGAARELEAHAVQADVTSEEDCVRVVAEHVERHGGMDVLVNSAGVGIAGPIADLSTKRWDLQQNVNLRGAFLVTRESLPHLRLTHGHVVNVASIAGTMPTPGLAGYGASKAALVSLTHSLNREEADNGVRAVALCPAFVETPMTEWTGLPSEELIQPEDCAELVRAVLRLSPRARVAELVVERVGDAY
jgi:3-oxoacyl-[acyl-carrier protein] reductase